MSNVDRASSNERQGSICSSLGGDSPAVFYGLFDEAPTVKKKHSFIPKNIFSNYRRTKRKRFRSDLSWRHKLSPVSRRGFSASHDEYSNRRHGDTKRTSWMFIQAQPNDASRHLSNRTESNTSLDGFEFNSRPLLSTRSEKQVVIITPISSAKNVLEAKENFVGNQQCERMEKPQEMSSCSVPAEVSYAKNEIYQLKESTSYPLLPHHLPSDGMFPSSNLDLTGVSCNGLTENEKTEAPLLHQGAGNPISAKKGVIHIDIKTGDVKCISTSSEVTCASLPDEELNLDDDTLKKERRVEDLSSSFRCRTGGSFPPRHPGIRRSLDATDLQDSEIGDIDSPECDCSETSTVDGDEPLLERNYDNLIPKALRLRSEIEAIKPKSPLSKSCSLPCVAEKTDMGSLSNSYVTKKQVHDAMLLINECLSDQQCRSLRSLNPYDPCLGLSGFSSLSDSLRRRWSEGEDLDEELGASDGHHSDEDPFDLTWCDEILDGVISELSEDSGSNFRLPVQRDSTSSQKNSVDSGHGIEPANRSPLDCARTATSNSDVDSGIDGSALASPSGKMNRGKRESATSLSGTPPLAQKCDKFLRHSDGAESKDSEEMTSLQDEDDEERRVREEIEKTRAHLSRLHEQQIHLKKQRDDGKNRYSYILPSAGTTDTEDPIVRKDMFYATIPKSPLRTATERRYQAAEVTRSGISAEETTTKATTMLSTAFQIGTGPKQYSHFGKTSPGFQTPDPAAAKRADLFTPSYAHPMHHPERMTVRDFSGERQQEEEERRRREEEEQQKMKSKGAREKKKEDVDVVNQASPPLSPPTRLDFSTTKKPKLKTSSSHQKKAGSVPATPVAAAKSDELQLQLDELDQYIAELSHSFDSDTREQPPLRRSFSCASADDGRPKRMDLPVPGRQSARERGQDSKFPPKPPSRDQSSFASVSRRLPRSGDARTSWQAANQSGEHSVSAEDVELSASPRLPKPPLPPQSSPISSEPKQIAATTPTSPTREVPRKTNNLEDRISPQLFIAMALNPGGRPTENIHSYKEDLDPSFGTDAVDSGSPVTPAFPVSPKTPYVNDKSPLAVHFPAGSVRTPLSVLGLQHNPKPIVDHDANDTSEDGPKVNDVTKQLNNMDSPPLNSSRVQFDQRLNGINTHQHQALNGRRKGPQDTGPSPGSYLSEIRHQNPPSNHSHDSGFADSHPVSTNGWIPSEQPGPNTTQTRLSSGYNHHHQPEQLNQKYSASATAHSRVPVKTTAYGSLSGSSDSLLSDGSSSNHSNLSHQPIPEQSQPTLPPKESSLRRAGSGHTPGSSQTSPTATTPTVFNHTPPSYPAAQRRASQMSSYEKQGSRSVHRNIPSDDTSSNPTSSRTSSSSVSELDKLAHELAGLPSPTPKFIKDTTSFWYKPDISREQALAMLRYRTPGSFVVRDSRCYPGAFGLALRVRQVPASVLATAKPGTDLNDELVRHFLIEPNERGVRLKGSVEERVFGSLSALIYQHSITPIALPCKLVIPIENQEVLMENGSGSSSGEVSNTATELLRQGAACNVLYVGSVETELLTGSQAVGRAVNEILQHGEAAVKTSVVHFKVSLQGITLTDKARKIFFRRHYPTSTVTFCGMDPSARDPTRRRWTSATDGCPPDARMFGFVAKKTGSSVDNVCHVFAELDLDQPANAIANFVSKILIGSG